MEWGTFIAHPGIDAGITVFIQGMGFFFLLCALAALFIGRLPGLCRPILITGGVFLLILAFLYAKERFYLAAQFFEYTLQWGSPFLLVIFQRKGRENPDAGLRRWVKVAIALTFTCHGLFAMGIYPTPGSFLEMTMNILGVSQVEAVGILQVAGALDLVLSVLLFLPPSFSVPAAAYAVFWGFSTTIARIWAYARVMEWEGVLLQWLHESIMRMPHFLIPLAFLLFLLNDKAGIEEEKAGISGAGERS